MKPTSAWVDDLGQSWLEHQTATDYQVQVFTFDHEMGLVDEVNSKAPTMWQRALDLGSNLLHSLVDLVQTMKVLLALHLW
jgi:hypothetical protein